MPLFWEQIITKEYASCPGKPLTLLQEFYGPLHPGRSCVQHVMFQIQCFSSFLSFLPKKQSKVKCIKLVAYLRDDKTLAILTGNNN